MRVRWWGVLLVLTGFWGWPASVIGAPPDSCVIEVEVEDGSGRPLADADVAAIGPSVARNRRTATDRRGRATLLDLPAGRYRMEISRAGYQWFEFETVRCAADQSVRLSVTLRAFEGDEVVLMPSGPSVDPESTAFGVVRDRASLQALPRERAVPGRPADGLPRSAVEDDASIRGGSDWSPGPLRIVRRRRPDFDPTGSAGFELIGGLSPRTTGTRGAGQSVEDGIGVHAAAGLRARRAPVAGLVALEWRSLGWREAVAFGSVPDGVAEVRRRHDSDRHVGHFFGSVVWNPVSSRRLEADLQMGRWAFGSEAVTLHLAPGWSAPTGDETHGWRRWGVAWHGLAGDRSALWVEAEGGEQSSSWHPNAAGVLEQDATADGGWSDGLGNGIWLGSGNLAGFDLTEQSRRIEAGGQVAAGGAHRLHIAASWDRGDRRLRFSGVPGNLGFGERRTYKSDGSQRWDALAVAIPARGREDSKALVLQDTWRLGSGVTAVAGVGWRDARLAGATGEPNLRFDGTTTLSPRIGLVWDFEGSGRSRAWIRWARFRPGAGEAVAWRMTGALDVSSRFLDAEGVAENRAPGTMVVAADVEPPVTDETVGGVEYELLSHLVVGAAGLIRRSDDGLAFLTSDGGRTLVLASPSGPDWPDGLRNRTDEASFWIHKRFWNGWQAEVRTVWARRRGTWAGPSTIDLTDVDREYRADVIAPQALAGARGPLDGDRRWRVDLSGSWRFLAGPSVGGRLVYRSGAPVSRLGSLGDGLGLDRRFVDQRGSAGRTPELWRLDLVGSWPFEFGGMDAAVTFNVFNALNAQRAVEVDQRWSVLDESAALGLTVDQQRTSGTWRRPLRRQNPLELTVGIRVGW